MFSKVSRRQFVNLAAGSAAGIGFYQGVPDIFAATEVANGKRPDGRVLVVVQLSGGNDGINTVVPFSDQEYYKNRFSLAIDRNAVRKIDENVGFHPALAGFSKLLEESQLAIVQGVGYPKPNRSHFESMDLWHTAHQSGVRINEGWLGRMIRKNNLDAKLDIPAIHLGAEKQPLALAADALSFPSIRSIERFRLKPQGNPKLKELVEKGVKQPRPDDDELLSFVQLTADSALKAGARIEKVLQAKSSAVVYPATPLAQKLQTVSKMIAAEMPTSVYYVTLDGFDTHANQADAHAGLLSQLGDALATFMEDLTEQGNDQRTLVLSFSEFGRRVRQNASHGTDHGTAGPVFLAGGHLKPGTHGKHPRLDQLVDGDLQFHTDYRQVYASILEEWFDIPSEPVLGGRHQSLDLFQQA